MQNNLENHIAPEIGPLCMPNRAQFRDGVFSVSCSSNIGSKIDAIRVGGWYCLRSYHFGTGPLLQVLIPLLILGGDISRRPTLVLPHVLSTR